MTWKLQIFVCGLCIERENELLKIKKAVEYAVNITCIAYAPRFDECTAYFD